MKNRIPLFFYLDLGVQAMTDKKRKEVFDWFNQVTKDNNMGYGYEPSKFNEHNGNYIGFIPSYQDTERQLGARQYYYEYDFPLNDMRKVSYDFWKKNIKNHKFNVIARKRDNDGNMVGRGVSKETVVLKEAKRNELQVAYLKSSSITKALKELGLQDKIDSRAQLIYKKDQQHFYKTGNSLYGHTESIYYGTFEMNGETLLTAFRTHGMRKGLWKKCEITGLYSTAQYMVDVITENGTVKRGSRSCIGNMPRSQRDNLWFQNRVAATNYGYARCEFASDWLPSAEARKKPNANYHSLERKWGCPKGTQATIGFEIEKADDEAYKIAYEDLYNNTNWIKESDSSLPSNGYELISPVFDLFSNQLEKNIKKNPELKTLINADYTERCGGHINIASKVYTPIQLLHGLRGFLPLLYAIWNVRMGNRYCTPYKIHHYVGKRGAMNVKDNVLEIRLASAVKSVKNLLWRRDLVRIMLENINKSELEVLRMMLNSRSKLHKHLRKVYNAERFMQKCNLFIKMTGEWNDIKLDEIDWDAIDAAKAESAPVIEED